MGEICTEKKKEDKRSPHDLIFSVRGFAQDGAFRPKLQTPENRGHKTDVPLHGTSRNKSPQESASFQTPTVPSSAQRRSRKPGMELATTQAVVQRRLMNVEGRDVVA